jgi:hypothetical protein
MAKTPPPPKTADFDKAKIDIRTVTRRQVFVDGQPVGEDFE